MSPAVQSPPRLEYVGRVDCRKRLIVHLIDPARAPLGGEAFRGYTVCGVVFDAAKRWETQRATAGSPCARCESMRGSAEETLASLANGRARLSAWVESPADLLLPDDIAEQWMATDTKGNVWRLRFHRRRNTLGSWFADVVPADLQGARARPIWREVRILGQRFRAKWSTRERAELAIANMVSGRVPYVCDRVKVVPS